MRIDSDQVSDDSDFQEDSVSGSTVLINVNSAKQQTSIELDNSSVQDEDDVEPLVNSHVENQHESTDILNQGLDDLAMNIFNGSDAQISYQIQDKELSDNLTSSTLSTNSSLPRDFNRNIDFFPNDDSQQDKRSYEPVFNSRVSETLSEESQEREQSEFESSLDEMVTNVYASIKNDTEMQKSKSPVDPSNDSTSNQDDLPKRSDHGGSIKGKNLENYYSIDSSSQIEFGKDLVDCITGLYRLLELRKVDGSSTVDKTIISRDYLKKLCNDMVSSSFRSISEINYTKLNSKSLRLIGCYGNHALIAKFLLDKKAINRQIHDLLVVSQSFMENTNESSLRPGLYLLVVNPDLGLVIHWPEIGCYEENSSSRNKNNMINLHRCLTKLTDYQLCLMSDKDLECFDWNLNNSDLDSDDENKGCYEFEVKKSREEQDDFKIHSGFKMNLSQKIKTELNNNIQYDIPLYPLVVESTTSQSFITRKLAKKLNKKCVTFSALLFSTEFYKLLEGRSLYINRESMNMKQLELLIKSGFKPESKLLELLEQFYDKINAAKERKEEKIEKAKDIMKEDVKVITSMGWKNSYSIFDKADSTFFQENNKEDRIISEEEINRIQSKYPEVKEMIKKIQINSPTWIKMKQRYALTYLVINAIYRLLEKNSAEKVRERAIKEFYNMFVDEETDTQRLVEKYERRSQNFFSAEQDRLTFDSLRINQTVEQSKKYTQNKSDSAFVQESLINSQFFGRLNDIKQNVLRAFIDEYQNWRNENFPNSVRELVPEFSFNKQSMDEINEEFSQEKKIIENREFERICNELEKNYHNGPLCLNVINVTDDDIHQSGKSFCLTYELETNQLQINIYETSLDEPESSQIQDDELFVPNPVLSSHYFTGQYCVDFQVDPIIYDFRKISQFANRKFLLVLYNKKLERIEIFFDEAQRFPRIFKKSDSIKPFKTLNIDENFLIAINEPKELIAILDTKKVVLNVFAFSEDKENLYARDQNIQLRNLYNNMVPELQHFLFIKDTEELCFVERSGQARIFNLINKKFRPAVCMFPSNTTNVLSSPDGSCIVAFSKEGRDSSSRAYVYFCSNFGGSVKKVVTLPSNFQSLEFLQFTDVNKLQTHLVSLDLQNGYFNSVIVKITLEKTQYLFQERMQRVKLSLSQNNTNYINVKGKGTYFEKNVQKGQNIVIMGEKYNVIKVHSDTKLKVTGNFKPTNGLDKWVEFDIEPIEPKTKTNDLIDVYRAMFEKYPVENCVDPEQNRPLSLKIVLDINDDSFIEEYREKFENYISDMFENLRYTTKKPATSLKKFSTSVITFQELDIENANILKKYSSEYELGEWIIKLCCLIPVQIAVVRNNLFQPNEGERVAEFEEEYGRHINSIAKNISFEWYEGILNHFGRKQVKVVSSMGEQSCEKSFMLNHLVGTSFDGTSMRCSEGVWMSLVNTKECIYVVLDFEGLRRTPQEGLFLTLFNTIISNLILFKNQFAVNNDMLSMFRRFQNGAILFESGSKVFQNNFCAKLCIIIKDIPKTDKEEIVSEFKSKISQLVSEEGEDNFISRMYKGGLDIIPWPTFNDAAWFKSLSNINKKLVRQELKHDNARTFLQNTKVIMAKLKICDWSSLDETFAQIRVVILKSLLPNAISFGLEQRDPVIELMNHDTGEPIDDPVINLSDVLHNFERSIKLLPDFHIRLFDERESFVRLSKDLRDYFEKNIQPRKESSDDSEWFASFDRFLKCIIERRVSRIREWYSQNTAKFPKDNSSVVNGKFELEQIIISFTQLWTLCGLTCHQCGLKCVKDRDHEENHDCLTDHKCHFLCDFTEVHNDVLIPKCNHKAGHEGKHTCNKMKHTCGKPCNLIGKRNCQEVCSKEIGHDGKHLCQSTRHDCGEDCSLSTYTQRGDYRCPNKCIIPHNQPHDSHRCENETCPVKCPIPSCQRSCESNDHLHAYSDLQVNHFCGNEHPCQELCEEDGVCKVITVPRQQITFTKYAQHGDRLKCNKKIPPNEFSHTGKHAHEDGFHFCDTKCPFCGYYCTLPYGHSQIHETRHGNMAQNELDDDTDDDEELEYSGHQLGDQGTFVLCNLRCKDLGRHTHVDFCQNEENCTLGNQKQDIQHINERTQPHPDRPKDLISHKLYWERTGFKDPYSVQEQKEFAKCNHECKDHEFQESTSAPYCELPLFHAPLDPNSDPEYGHISDGHHFECEIPE